MSRRVYKVNTSEFKTDVPIPVVAEPVKVGNGKATYKTATAAARAAESARDETRNMQDLCASYVLECERVKLACRTYCESMWRLMKKDMWWKAGLAVLLITNIISHFFLIFC